MFNLNEINKLIYFEMYCLLKKISQIPGFIRECYEKTNIAKKDIRRRKIKQISQTVKKNQGRYMTIWKKGPTTSN